MGMSSAEIDTFQRYLTETLSGPASEAAASLPPGVTVDSVAAALRNGFRLGATAVPADMHRALERATQDIVAALIAPPYAESQSSRIPDSAHVLSRSERRQLRRQQESAPAASSPSPVAVPLSRRAARRVGRVRRKELRRQVRTLKYAIAAQDCRVAGTEEQRSKEGILFSGLAMAPALSSSSMEVPASSTSSDSASSASSAMDAGAEAAPRLLSRDSAKFYEGHAPGPVLMRPPEELVYLQHAIVIPAQGERQVSGLLNTQSLDLWNRHKKDNLPLSSFPLNPEESFFKFYHSSSELPPLVAASTPSFVPKDGVRHPLDGLWCASRSPSATVRIDLCP